MIDIYQYITIKSIYEVYKRLINLWTKKAGSRQMMKYIYLPNTDQKKAGGEAVHMEGEKKLLILKALPEMNNWINGSIH